MKKTQIIWTVVLIVLILVSGVLDFISKELVLLGILGVVVLNLITLGIKAYLRKTSKRRLYNRWYIDSEGLRWGITPDGILAIVHGYEYDKELKEIVALEDVNHFILKWNLNNNEYSRYLPQDLSSFWSGQCYQFNEVLFLGKNKIVSIATLIHSRDIRDISEDTIGSLPKTLESIESLCKELKSKK